ncbi:MAG: ribonuclease J [Bacilli bacterium]|nr:ribonuclease J [Bacilli bacterium]
MMNNVKVFALGGLGEVGKNMYAIEAGDEIAVVDSGILFPDSAYGINYIFPDVTYLKENEEKIVGIFITHGHEDHIGGLPFLFQYLTKPKIYATGLALGLIKNKFSEYTNLTIDIIEYNSESVFKFNNFEVSFFRTTHSIPDSFGIAFKTKIGYILHTGDFKFDLTPIGPGTEFDKLSKYSSSGVTLLLSDSTNAIVNHLSPSEKVIGENLSTIFSQIKGRIIISTFASNVYRVDQIVKACIENGRKLVVIGRSMVKTISVAREMGYIHASDDIFVDLKDYTFLPDNKIVILCTGSQGEPLAALSRIATGSHPYIKVTKGDTIIFSSSIIPGNQASINKIVNNLYKAGASVIANSPLLDTHTSGHASKEELKLMLQIVKPKFFMPIHGEYAMLKTHVDLAIEAGIPKENCFIMENGDVLELSKTKASISGKVYADNLFIDNNDEIINGATIKERRMLSEEGMISIVFMLNKEKVVELPILNTIGFVYAKDSSFILSKVKFKAADKLKQYIASTKEYNKAYAQGLINNEIINFLDEEIDRRPMIITTILDI